MMEKEHIHSWHTFSDDKVICRGCDTISELETLLHNIAADSSKATKIDLLSGLLFNRELKKDAPNRLYSWVLSQRGVSDPLATNLRNLF